MAVPNTDTFTLQDVKDELESSSNDLVSFFAEAVDANFDPLYKGDKNSLYNFRNYGATVVTRSYTIVHIYELGTPAPWSNIINGTTNATSATDGLSNSNLIVAQSGHTTSAAKKCLDLVSGGYSDWYLPAREEIPRTDGDVSTVNAAILSVGGDPISDNTGTFQWTSVEYNSESAQAFRGRTLFGNPPKTANFKTRAVRKETSTNLYSVGDFNFGGIIIRVDII